MDKTLPETPVKFSEFTWRPAGPEDIPLLEELGEANRIADGREVNQTAAEYEQIFKFLGERAGTDTLLALTPDNRIAAIGLVFIPPSLDAHRATLAGSVRADYRGKGLGTFLMDWLEARARQRIAEFEDGKPGFLMAGCRDTMADRIELFQNQGFRPVRYFNHMRRPLENIPDRQLPAGLHFELWDASRNDHFRDVFARAFAGHYQMIEITPEIWQQQFVGTPHFRGDLTLFAMDGEQIAGFVLTTVFDGANEQTGIREAVMDGIGVLPEYRGRGVASAAMAEAMQMYARSGFERTALDVDTENVTKALALYTKMGFESVRTTIRFQKEI